MKEQLYDLQLKLQQPNAESLFFEEWSREADHETKNFLDEDLHKLKAECFKELAGKIENIYTTTALFPKTEVKNKLSQVEFGSLHWLWFIKYEDILLELKKINEEGLITLDIPIVLELIRAHLFIKIYVEVARWSGQTVALNGKPFVPKLKGIFNNTIKQKKSGSKKKRKIHDEKLKFFEEVMEDFSEVLGYKQLADRYMFQMLGGETKKNLLALIIELAQPRQTTNKFYRQFFSLFKLICPTETMFSEEEFYIAESKFNRNSRSYLSYQAKRVKDIIKSTTPFFGSL